MDSPFGKSLQAAFWLLLFTSNIYLGSLAMGWEDAALRAGFNTTCHLINFYAFYSWLVPNFYERKRYLLFASLALLILILLTPARTYIETNFRLTGELAQRLGTRGRTAFIIFTEISVAAFASLMRLAVHNEHNKSRLSELMRLQAETELRFLKAQMNPHFLFNTINNIYALTLTKSDKAPESLMKLSGLLRYLLYESHSVVPLAKEVEMLRDYAHLFRLRYEHEINLKILAEVEDGRVIEPLILLPILENAIKHSGLGVHSTSFIQLDILCDRSGLSVHCTNSINTPASGAPGGSGLSNITKRLQLAYPDRHTLTIGQTSKQFTLRLIIRES